MTAVFLGERRMSLAGPPSAERVPALMSSFSIWPVFSLEARNTLATLLDRGMRPGPDSLGASRGTI